MKTYLESSEPSEPISVTGNYRIEVNKTLTCTYYRIQSKVRFLFRNYWNDIGLQFVLEQSARDKIKELEYGIRVSYIY